MATTSANKLAREASPGQSVLKMTGNYQGTPWRKSNSSKLTSGETILRRERKKNDLRKNKSLVTKTF